MPTELLKRKCCPIESGSHALADAASDMLLVQVPDWRREEREIVRDFNFKNHYEAIAFVNAVAFISHQQDHHPTMIVGYNRVSLRYSTHSVNGLSENDFICAAKVSALFS